MSDSTTLLDTISASQASKEVTANAMFDAASHSTLYGRRASTTTGLTWGFYGGVLNILGTLTAIANGTVALTASQTNYVEANPADGVVSKNIVAFTAGYIPLYTIVTGAATVTSYTDHRALLLASQRGRARGVASLDASGYVPLAELPPAIAGALQYQGTWNASTNTPTLASGVGTKGYYYVVSVAGTTDLDGHAVWSVNDMAIFNGTTWDILQGGITSAEVVAALGYTPQASDAELDALAGLTSAADKLPYFTGSGTAALADLTAAARTVLDDATVSAMVDTLGGAASTGTGGLVRKDAPTLSQLVISGTTNDGTSLMANTQLGTGRSIQADRTVGSATRPVATFSQNSATGGTQATVLIRQADTGEVALGINTDGSLTVFNFKVLDTGAFTANGMAALNGGATVTGPIRTSGYTVETLPVGVTGDMARVTDALAPTYLGALTGGGAVESPAFKTTAGWVSA